MSDNFKEESLYYHRYPVPGKLAIEPTKPMANKRDLARAYSPGVAYACEAIVEDPKEAASLTARGNLVGVITNGTAVLGLGAIGPLASKPVMEGKAVLFKKFANIDVFDIEFDESDPDKLIEHIAALEPTFGGINLEDIKAPECFYIEKQLRERMSIPVFHDDQHGTAIVAAAAVYNGLSIVNKKMEEVKLVASGGGAASIACIDLLVSMGLSRDNVYVCDSRGVVYKGRVDGMNEYKEKYAQDTLLRTLDDAIADADIFMGLSGPGVLTQDMVKKMADKPLILAMANPTPEILPELAREARPDAIIATGRSDYPNQVNNVLCFPFIFRGALDCGATTINEEMKLACVKAIAALARKESSEVVAAAYADEELKFGPEYLIPKPFDTRLIEELPVAVVEAAMASGVAARPIDDLVAYRRKLHSSVHRSGLFMQPIFEVARRSQERLVYAEGENEDVLRAVQAVVDEKIARPIVIGRPDIIQERIEQMGLRLQAERDFELVNPEKSEGHQEYWEYYHSLVGRNGVSVEAAKSIIHTNSTVLAAVIVALGEADGLICGKVGRFDYHMRDIMGVIGPRARGQHVSSTSTLLLPKGEPLFLADSFINVDPTAEQIVETAKASIEVVRHFGVKPKVALLSHSNFGTSNASSAIKMRKASEILRATMPDVQIDGEMHAMSAMRPELLRTVFKDSVLKGQANLLIMPNLDTANIALGLIRSLTNALLIGPLLSGLAKPAHIVIPSVTPRGILNMSAYTAADIQRYKGKAT
ncbi:MAG: NADP-dependent malic enzyme [Pseudomonadales bacterium]|nr:NADP-dependent malic enzyme [Pseudomonadales bacterium]MCP5216004.1 NADP-dependent malic enzyme [Pseudomonadales bacterium]